MATDQTRTVGGDAPDDPADLLPEESILSLDEYLDRHAAVGHRTRYEILYRLVHSGEMSPKELEEALDVDDSTLRDHLNKLVDDGQSSGNGGGGQIINQQTPCLTRVVG